MALPSWLLVFVGGRRSQRPGPSPTLGSLGPSHHRRHKSWVSLRGPPCAHGVLDIPFGEVRDMRCLGWLCLESRAWLPTRCWLTVRLPPSGELPPAFPRCAFQLLWVLLGARGLATWLPLGCRGSLGICFVFLLCFVAWNGLHPGASLSDGPGMGACATRPLVSGGSLAFWGCIVSLFS
jgi:hypothetical protein